MKRNIIIAFAVIVVAIAVGAGIALKTANNKSTDNARNTQEQITTNPNDNPNALDILISNDEYEATLKGKPINDKLVGLTDNEIESLIKGYNKKDIAEYEATYKRNFSEDYKEYAKEAFRITTGRHRIHTPYSLTFEDITLIDNIKSEDSIILDLLYKSVDEDLSKSNHFEDFNKLPLYKQTEYLKIEYPALIEAKRNEFINDIYKEENMEPDERELDSSIDTNKEDYEKDKLRSTLLTMSQRTEAIEYKKQLLAENKVEELNKDFLNNVDSNQTNLFVNQVPNIKEITTDELIKAANLGVEGIYILEHSDEYEHPIYLIGTINDQMGLTIQGDMDTTSIQGFDCVSSKSGIAVRMSKTTANDFIIEMAYIPSLAYEFGVINNE